MSSTTTRSSRLSTFFAALVIVTLVASSILGFGKGLLVGALVAGVVALAKVKAAKEESDSTAGNTYPLLALLFALAIPTPAHAEENWMEGKTLQELETWETTVAAPKTEELIDSIAEVLDYSDFTLYTNRGILKHISEKKEELKELWNLLGQRKDALQQLYCTPFDFLNSAGVQALVSQMRLAAQVLGLLSIIEEHKPQGRVLHMYVEMALDNIAEIEQENTAVDDAMGNAYYLLKDEGMEGNCHR